MFLVGAGIVPEFKDPTKWSSEFHDFLGQMLKIDPAERPTAADLLKHPWIKTADDRKSMRNTLHELFIEKSLGMSAVPVVGIVIARDGGVVASDGGVVAVVFV